MSFIIIFLSVYIMYFDFLYSHYPFYCPSRLLISNWSPYICFLCVCVCVHLQGPEGGYRSGVISGCESLRWVLGTEHTSLDEQEVPLTSAPSFQPPLLYFL